MKSVWMMFLGLAVSGTSLASPLPSAPSGCFGDILRKGFCSSYKTSGVVSGSITVDLFAVVYKEDYPSVEELFNRFSDFERWPEFAEASGRTDVLFSDSRLMDEFEDENGKTMVHYSDYRLNSVIGYQSIRVVTNNTIVEPFEGALGSIVFNVKTEGEQQVPEGADPLEGAEGVQFQDGSVHAVDCVNSILCDDDQMLLIYQTTVRPDIDLLPSLAATAITNGIESLLIGMFLTEDSDDPVF